VFHHAACCLGKDEVGQSLGKDEVGQSLGKDEVGRSLGKDEVAQSRIGGVSRTAPNSFTTSSGLITFPLLLDIFSPSVPKIIPWCTNRVKGSE
jgi:hypothetical protein